ncbi:metallophosphoesterase [Emticicia oligotrophica DSM 17448]|uniref:Metallophosphoesterase n=1 Tax=Emticicia oligotrophica (strain DSM 17448 / CIP 109782 / MTCC 6937 / GPTSA100-15) TaxID=929562 RepID=A0ABM5N572_EMTOG|nr:UDP-2,3-diacylglucosamine diphosphatase [Emticicia oligotrophica]AFK04611.1 metallophosphoesterase [Emticicia oligotrophica DSM 17448]
MNRIIPTGKKIYFASDFHLGAPSPAESLKRERIIIDWLENIRHDAEVIFLVGDLFDFWHEYKYVVPKGSVRFLGKLAELSDSGIEIIIFLGNRDMWMSDYFETELKIQTIRKPRVFTFNQKTFYVGHGDGLGADDMGYKILKVIFEGKLPRFLFGRIMHPNLGMKLGLLWTKNSWKKKRKPEQFKGEEKEHLVQYSKRIEAQNHHDFYVFGHRHTVVEMDISSNAKYFNLGDWIWHYSYAVFDGEKMQLHNYQPKE